jgi:membrane associated rhomboid family serine protease
MLIPIRHENMSARRWPVITFALIAINVLVFLATFQTLQDDIKRVGDVRLHLVLLAAAHPELNTSSEVQETVSKVKRQYPKDWAELSDRTRRPVDAWDRQMLQKQDEDELQGDMNSLSVQLQQAKENSIAEKYAFIPAHPSAISFITANFLHGGWMHLIGNMWFLWLAGFVLEDLWGRWLYTAFYLIAGAAAMQFDAWLNAGSTVATLGASGAVAALMGAFLVRFPKMKIEMLWWIFLRPRRFKAAAYWLLPLWLAMEIFYGSLFGQSTGVAHWAHVGGFVFGALAALGLRYSGLEQKANQKIEADLTLQSDAEIQEASDLIDKGEFTSAEEILNDYLSRRSNSLDACNLLVIIHRKKSNTTALAEALARLCAIHLKAGENELAWKCYEEIRQAGGQAPPPTTWLDLCRAAEKLEHFDRALAEYEKLASAYPKERQSILAQLAAARLCLKRLNQPERALQLFEAADKSPVPHLDWEQSIVAGIKEAKAAMSQKVAVVGMSG